MYRSMASSSRRAATLPRSRDVQLPRIWAPVPKRPLLMRSRSGAASTANIIACASHHLRPISSSAAASDCTAISPPDRYATSTNPEKLLQQQLAKKVAQRAFPAPPSTRIPQLASSLDGSDGLALAQNEDSIFLTREWSQYDVSVRLKQLLSNVKDSGITPAILLDALQQGTSLSTLSMVDMYMILRTYSSQGLVDLSAVTPSVWEMVLREIVQLRHQFLLKLFICDIDAGCADQIFENNHGLAPKELLDKLRSMRKKRGPEAVEPTFTTVDLIEPLLVTGGHFAVPDNSEHQLELLYLVLQQATSSTGIPAFAGTELLFTPNLVAQLVRRIASIDWAEAGEVSYEQPPPLPGTIARLPRESLRSLFRLLVRSEDTSVALFYVVDGLRTQIRTLYSVTQADPSQAFPNLTESSDLLLYYMNTDVYLLGLPAEDQASDHFTETKQPCEPTDRNAPPDQPQDDGTVLFSDTPEQESQRQMALVGAMLSAFTDLQEIGLITSGISAETAQATLGQATADAEKLIPWLRAKTIAKLTHPDSPKGISGPTLAEMEIPKFRLTLRVASLRLLAVAEEHEAAARSLFLLARDMFWMHRSLEARCHHALTPSEEIDPRNYPTNVFQELMSELLIIVFDQVAAKPSREAVKSLLAAMEWAPPKSIFAISPEQAHRLIQALTQTGMNGDAAEFLSAWLGLDAVGNFTKYRRIKAHELSKLVESEDVIVGLIKGASERLHYSRTLALAQPFQRRLRGDLPGSVFRTLPFLFARLGFIDLQWRTQQSQVPSIRSLEEAASFVSGMNEFVVSNTVLRRIGNPATKAVEHLYRRLLESQFGMACVPEQMPSTLSDSDIISLFNTSLLLREYDDMFQCVDALNQRNVRLPTNSIILLFKELIQFDPDEGAEALALLVADRGQNLRQMMPGLTDILPPNPSTVTLATATDNLFHTLWSRRFYAAASKLARSTARNQLGIKLGAHAYAVLHMASLMTPYEFTAFVHDFWDRGDIQHFAGTLINISRYYARGISIRLLLESSLAGRSEWSALFLNYPWRELTYHKPRWMSKLNAAIYLFKRVFLWGHTVEYRNALLLIKRIRHMADMFTDDNNRRRWSDRLHLITTALAFARRGAPYLPMDTSAWEIPFHRTRVLVTRPEDKELDRGGLVAHHPDSIDREVVPTTSGLAFGTGTASMLPDVPPSQSRNVQSYKHGNELPDLALYQLPRVPRPLTSRISQGLGPYYRDTLVGPFRAPFVTLSQAACGFATLGDLHHMKQMLLTIESYGLNAYKTQETTARLYARSKLAIPRWTRSRPDVKKPLRDGPQEPYTHPNAHLRRSRHSRPGPATIRAHGDNPKALKTLAEGNV